MSIFDDILDIPAKTLKKVAELPGDTVAATGFGLKRLEEAFEDFMEEED